MVQSAQAKGLFRTAHTPAGEAINRLFSESLMETEPEGWSQRSMKKKRQDFPKAEKEVFIYKWRVLPSLLPQFPKSPFFLRPQFPRGPGV